MATALRHDLEATMQALGESARAAARALATVSRAAKDRALLAARRASARAACGHPGGERSGSRRGARARAAGVAARPPGAGRGAHRGDGGRSRGGGRARRSGRAGDRPLAAAERPRHRARARAARRRRHHLRVAAQRHRRCRRAVPEGGQRGDPARRLGELSFVARDPRLPAAGAGGRRPAGERDPVRADHRSRRGRHAAHHERLRRRDRAARRPFADRAGAEGEPDPGAGASRRHLPRLSGRGGRPGDGARDHLERQDAAHLGMRCRRDPAGRPRRRRAAAAGRDRGPGRGRLRPARRCGGTGDGRACRAG